MTDALVEARGRAEPVGRHSRARESDPFARGLAVPGAVRLVGFDDLPIARQTVPPLTTIRQDIAAGARGLVDLLLRRIAGEATESLILPPELVVRETA